MTQSKAAPLCGIKTIEELTLKSLFFESVIYVEVAGTHIEESDVRCPVRMWNASVERLTLVKKSKDVVPCYKQLVKIINDTLYKGKLAKDPMLFIEDL